MDFRAVLCVESNSPFPPPNSFNPLIFCTSIQILQLASCFLWCIFAISFSARILQGVTFNFILLKEHLANSKHFLSQLVIYLRTTQFAVFETQSCLPYEVWYFPPTFCLTDVFSLLCPITYSTYSVLADFLHYSRASCLVSTAQIRVLYQIKNLI